MRAAAIARFGYHTAPDASRDPAEPSPPGGAADPTVVAMDPLIVRADRGLPPRQYRALDSSLQQQEQAAAARKFSIVKVHDYKVSRKVHFGYVTLLGIPVLAGFSW